jgi:Tfp pilus assembly protein PilF
MGNADMALDDWLAVKQQEPNQENISKYLSIAGKYFFNQGMKYKNTGKNDSAITAFHKSIEAMPSVVAPFLELSRAYSSETKFNEAKEAVDSALKMEPNNTDAINLKKAIIFDEISVQSTIQWNYVEPAVSKKPNKR